MTPRELAILEEVRRAEMAVIADSIAEAEHILPMGVQMAEQARKDLAFPPDLKCPVCGGQVFDLVGASSVQHPRASLREFRYVCRDLRCNGQMTEFEAGMWRRVNAPDRVIGGERFSRDD